MSTFSKLHEILKSYGLDNENATEEIIEFMSNPHGLSKHKVDEKLQIDRDQPHDSKFDKLYPLSTVLAATEYGLDYALNSQHSGIVPKGNILQWLSNLDYIDGLQPLKLKLDVEQAEMLLDAVDTKLAALDYDNWNKEIFETKDDHKYHLEMLHTDINTYIENNK